MGVVEKGTLEVYDLWVSSRVVIILAVGPAGSKYVNGIYCASISISTSSLFAYTLNDTGILESLNRT